MQAKAIALLDEVDRSRYNEENRSIRVLLLYKAQLYRHESIRWCVACGLGAVTETYITRRDAIGDSVHQAVDQLASCRGTFRADGSMPGLPAAFHSYRSISSDTLEGYITAHTEDGVDGHDK